MVAVLIVALCLAACETGRVDEARDAAERDATRGAVLPDVQATSIAERFRPPTPTPMPTPTLAPALAQLVLTSGVGPSGAPRDELRLVPAYTRTTIYAAAQLSHVQPGQTVVAIWANAAGGEIQRTTARITSGAASQWVALPLTLDGTLPPGSYAVYLYVDEYRLTSLVFRIG